MVSKRTMKRANEYFDKIDQFSKKSPQLNFNGRQSVSSFCGLGSTLVYTIFIAVATSTLMTKLILRSNPNISQYSKYDRYETLNDSLNLGDHNFTIAVAINRFEFDENFNAYSSYLDPKEMGIQFMSNFIKFDGKQYEN